MLTLKLTAGPPPLQSIIPDENDPIYMDLKGMLPRLKDTMTRYQVSLDSVQDMQGSSPLIAFLHRTKGEVFATRENLTVFIPAIWNEAQPLAWLRVVSDLRQMLVLGTRTRPVKVELIARQLYLPQAFDAVKENHPIVEIWNTLQTKLHGIIL